MKTMFKLFAVIALVAATLSHSSNVSAGGGGGGTYKFKGLGANVFYSSVDELGCIFTQTFVFANEQTINNSARTCHSGVYMFPSISRSSIPVQKHN